MVNYGRTRKTTDDNITRRMRIAYWVHKATNTHSECVILTAFRIQQWLHERPSMLRYTLYYNKVRELILAGLFIMNFLPIVNQVYYLEVLKRLREKGRRKRPKLFANNSWISHHDNAPAHRALSVREFLAAKQVNVLEHPVYSTDLAPSDFFLFPKIKELLKGRHLMTLITSGVIQRQL